MASVLSLTWIRRILGLGSLLYMAGIYWLSDQPGVHATPPFLGADKVFHFLLYAVLGGLLQLTLQRRNLVLLIGSIYGVLDEIHQFYVPGRSCDPFDMLADALGVVVGSWVAAQLLRG